MLAERIGFKPCGSLVEFLQRISHRELRTWVARFRDEMNRPDRRDWYVMDNTREIRRIFNALTSSSNIPPKASDMILEFVEKAVEKVKTAATMTEEELKAWAEKETAKVMASRQTFARVPRPAKK